VRSAEESAPADLQGLLDGTNTWTVS